MSGEASLLDPRRLDELSRHLAMTGADGWLLYDFHDRNPLAASLLGVTGSTRRSFALFPSQGEPMLLRHAIEASTWSHWPWDVRTYVDWQELSRELARMLSPHRVVAMEVSSDDAVPAVDRVPAGVVELVRTVGSVEVVSSGDLITFHHAVWSSRGLELHRRAAEIVRDTVLGSFRLAAQVGRAEPMTETALADHIRARLREAGLTDQEDCIVAVGAAAADPHYRPEGEGRLLGSGELVLIDAWGRDPDGGIPADQTWMGFLGTDPPGPALEAWEAVREARDRALEFLAVHHRNGTEVRGHEVDRVARDSLERRGLGDHFVHRLGHSIDERLHGSGPDLDSLEAREERRLIPGVGFSVEPGVYIPGELGMRSEVNVFWGTDEMEVTPTEIQRDLLTFPPG